MNRIIYKIFYSRVFISLLVLSVPGCSGSGNSSPLLALAALFGNSSSGSAQVTTGQVVVSNLIPVNNSSLKSLTTISVSFSGPVLGAATASNYVLGGAGKGTLAVSSAVLADVNTNKYTVNLSGVPADGILTLSIVNVTNTQGTPNSISNFQYLMDVTKPQISSTSPVAGVTLNNLTSMDVVFTENVNISEATNIANYTLSGAGKNTLSITGITQNSGQSDNYHITFSGTPASTGTVTLTVSNISDTVGNIMNSANVNYTADKNGPTFTLSNTSSWIADLTTLTITFSEPVANANLVSSYGISGTGKGTLSLQSVTPGAGNAYTLNFTGSLSGDGTLINITSSAITDLAGNAAPSMLASYGVDGIAPNVVYNSIKPDPQPYDSLHKNLNPVAVTYTKLNYIDLEFSESLTNYLLTSSYTLSGSGIGTLAISAVNNISSTSARLILTGSLGNGEVTVTVNAKDRAGRSINNNPLTYSTAVSKSVTVKQTFPTANFYSVAWNGLSGGNSIMVTVGTETGLDGAIYYSNNGGASFAAVSAANAAGCLNSPLKSVAYGNGNFIAVGSGDTATAYGVLCSSTNGTNWISLTLSNPLGFTNLEYSAVAFDASKSEFQIIGATRGSPTKAVCAGRSSNGTWSALYLCKASGGTDGLNTNYRPTDFLITSLPIYSGFNTTGPVYSWSNGFPAGTCSASVACQWEWYSSISPSVTGTNFYSILDLGAYGYLLSAVYTGTLSRIIINYSANNESYDPNLLGRVIRKFRTNGSYVLGVGDSGIIITSTNYGISWRHEDSTSAGTTILRDAVWDSSNSRWVVVGSGKLLWVQ